MKTKILIADDEPGIRRVISLLLSEAGYLVKMVENGKEALEMIDSFAPDVVLLDQQMPYFTGVEVLEKICKKNPDIVVVLVTAFGSISLAVDAVKKGAYDFIEKPFDNDNLLLTVKRAVEHSQMKEEINVLKQQLIHKNSPVIIGESKILKQLIAQTKKVAETDATVMINGESGTGKELIAKTIHSNSKRSENPFVAINCGAIPLTLIESELFGHEKGAFTDAKETRPGIFERANGGTLFLDEIGELPMDAQVKLLRILEDRKVTRLGGKKAFSVDVRIISATNRNLDEEVKTGNFRLDLLYRLNILTLTIPSLRERKEDIPLLTDYFINKYNKLLGLSIVKVTSEALNRLITYNWPGNVRDLENAIQSAMILSVDNTLSLDNLPLRIRGYESIPEVPVNNLPEGGIKEINSQVEKELILETLKKYNFNRTQAADALNISRKTLFNKMKKLGIEL